MKGKSLIMAILITGLAILPGYSKESEDSKAGEKTEVKIYGYIQVLPNNRIGTWKVNGKTIRVDQDTSIEEEYGPVKTGAYVKVEGYINGKVIIAEEIEVKKAKVENKDKENVENNGKVKEEK